MQGENMKAFCGDFNIIFDQVSRLSGEEEALLKKVHAKCSAANAAVRETTVRGERSYGWEEKR